MQIPGELAVGQLAFFLAASVSLSMIFARTCGHQLECRIRVL